MFNIVERLYADPCRSSYSLGCAIFYAASAGNFDSPASHYCHTNIHFHRIADSVTRG